MSKDYDPKDFGEDARDYTCNGKCSKCGNCCIPWLPITKEEYKTIKDYIDKNKIESVNLLEGKNFHLDCCFHDRKNHKCNIYEVRPEVCKNFICSKSFEQVDKDRKYYDARAEINGNTGEITPMDLLFYDSPLTLIFLIYHEFGVRNTDDLKKWLTKLGHSELSKAIDEEQISVEWSD